MFSRINRRTVHMAVVALGLIVVGAAAAMAWRATRAPQAPQPHFVEVATNTYILPRPDAIAEFALTRHDGTPFTNDALKGRWSFVFFGYTSCPDFCPATLAMFADVRKRLAAHAAAARELQVVMVSVDPERDTPSLLKAYVPQFHPEFVGVGGDAATIARLADSVGAVYAKVPGTSPERYLIDHSSAVLLVNPQGRLQGVFAAPHVPHDVVAGYLKIREQAGAVASLRSPDARQVSLAGR